MTINKVIVVGAGPAGLGVAALLQQANIDYLVLEKNEIGRSFLEWPKNMEMITPSFPSNAFGQMDLNSICASTSPAFSYSKEHLTGEEYAHYLHFVTNHFELNVQTNTEVRKVYQQNEGWLVETNQGQFFTKYLVWAAGEFQNPQINNISGAAHCLHSSHIKYPDEVAGNNFVIIGGYESGIQLAFELVNNDKRVIVINSSPVDDMSTSDPSKVLSPYTHAKYRQLSNSTAYAEVLGTVESVTKKETDYQIWLKDGTIIRSEQIPICATGFSLVTQPIEEFVLYRADGSPLLHQETDEFFGHKNMYLSGPSVRHDDHVFCFIYKFRQRFGVIAEDILKKENYEPETISAFVKNWKRNGMYLSDLSCCDEECVC
ncbi:MAG: NAD(P)/FAD-dependent oxidoreductase [Bacteroidota bacterium]